MSPTSGEYMWYALQYKPFWAPPAWVFAPVWIVLYVLILLSFGYIYVMTIRKKLSPFIAVPFILNLVANLIFSPIQFGLRSNALAAIDSFFILITLIWAMKKIFPIARWVAWINIPYLIWVLFATILQFTITWLNWK